MKNSMKTMIIASLFCGVCMASTFCAEEAETELTTEVQEVEVPNAPDFVLLTAEEEVQVINASTIAITEALVESTDAEQSTESEETNAEAAGETVIHVQAAEEEGEHVLTF